MVAWSGALAPSGSEMVVNRSFRPLAPGVSGVAPLGSRTSPWIFDPAGIAMLPSGPATGLSTVAVKASPGWVVLAESCVSSFALSAVPAVTVRDPAGESPLGVPDLGAFSVGGGAGVSGWLAAGGGHGAFSAHGELGCGCVGWFWFG
jgi:hypothetical protein